VIDGIRSFFGTTYYGNTIGDYLIAFLIVFAAFTAARIVRFILRRYLKKIADRLRIVDFEKFQSAAVKPLVLAIIFYGIYRAVSFLTIGKALASVVPLEAILRVLVIIIISYGIYRLCDILSQYLMSVAKKTETKLDDMIIPILRKSLKVLVVVLAILFSLQSLGFDVGTLIAGLGIGGLALALAARDSIANIFGSIMIFLDQPFKIGERILIDGTDGVVEEVGLRSTRIRTLTGHLVAIPNATIAGAKIENISKRPTIRMLTSIGVTYDTGYEKLQRAVQIIKDILARTENLMPDYFVFFDEFGESSLNIFIIFWVSKPDYWLFKGTCEKINFEIKRQFEEEGIEIAFPTQTIYLKQEKEKLDKLAPKYPPEPDTKVKTV